MSPSSWHLETEGRLRIGWARRPAIDLERLHPRERRMFDRLDQTPERRAEWAAARLGLARLLPPGAHVLTGRDGAPVVIGAAWAVSIAHEDGWVAVVARPGGGRVAVDLVPDSAVPAAARAIARIRARGAGEPGATWAAIECATKLDRIGVAVLLDRRVRIADRGRDAVAVAGLGPRTAEIRLRRLPGAVLAVGDRP